MLAHRPTACRRRSTATTGVGAYPSPVHRQRRRRRIPNSSKGPGGNGTPASSAWLIARMPRFQPRHRRWHRVQAAGAPASLNRHLAEPHACSIDRQPAPSDAIEACLEHVLTRRQGRRAAQSGIRRVRASPAASACVGRLPAPGRSSRPATCTQLPSGVLGAASAYRPSNLGSAWHRPANAVGDTASRPAAGRPAARHSPQGQCHRPGTRPARVAADAAPRRRRDARNSWHTPGRPGRECVFSNGGFGQHLRQQEPRAEVLWLDATYRVPVHWAAFRPPGRCLGHRS